MLSDYEFSLSLIPGTHQLEVFLVVKEGTYLDGESCTVNQQEYLTPLATAEDL